MDWWAYLLLALGVYVLAAGIPWLAYAVVRWLTARGGPYLEAEGDSQRQLQAALRQQRANWPAVPRLGRYRELDQKALDRLADLATSISDVEQLWPGLASYAGAPFGPLQVATLRGWPAMAAALAVRRDQRQVQRLLRVGERQLAEIVLLEGMVAEIPAAVNDLVQERARQAAALRSAIDAESQAGTTGLDDLRLESSALRSQAEQVGQSLEAAGSPSDEVLLRADRELEAIGAAMAVAETRLAAIAVQRQTAEALLAESGQLVGALQGQWTRLEGQGAREPRLNQELTEISAAAEQLRAGLAKRTPEDYAQVAAGGQQLKQRLVNVQQELDTLGAALQTAQEGVAGDLAAIEDAHLVVASLGEREAPVLADASLALVEEAAESYRLAEERLQVGSLQALRESSESSTRGQALLQQALLRARETAQLADQASALLQTVAPEHRQQLHSQLDALGAELGAYAVIWRNRLSAMSTGAGQDLLQAERLLDQLPQGLVARTPAKETELAAGLETLARASDLVAAAEARVMELETNKKTVLRQRAELDAAVADLRQSDLAKAQALYSQMLPATQRALDEFVARLEQESQTMLDPAQADYDVALGTWMPAIREELGGLLQQHGQDVRQLSRALRDRRNKLDRAWRRLQSLLDRDPRRPEEDVDRLFETFGAWWDAGEAAEGQAAAMQALVEVQAPELEARIQRALDQLEEGRRVNRDLARDLNRAQREVERAREQAARRGADSGWPHLAWDLREADDLWRRANEAERANAVAATIAQANALLEQAIELTTQAEQAYQLEQDTAVEAQGKLDTAYQSAARQYDAAVRQAAELRAKGPSPELTILEGRLDAARRDLDASREAVTVREAEQRLQLAQDTLRLVSG
jgi:hypothetical protein